MRNYLELVKILKSMDLDAYIVPKNNTYLSSDLLPHEERLKFITNFSGSYGFVVITKYKNDKSAIISDGRYKLQIEKEVDNKHFSQFEGGLEKVSNFLNSKKNNYKNVGVDPLLISKHDFHFLENDLKRSKIQLKKINVNLVDKIWHDKPKVPKSNIITLSYKYTGESHVNKILKLISIIKKHEVDAYLLFRPDCLSWLLNIRDNQLKYSPVVRGILIIQKSGRLHLFTEEKINKNLFKSYKNIELCNFRDLNKILKKLSKKSFLIDPFATPIKIIDLLKFNKIKSIEIKCPLMELKSKKNMIEQKMSKKTHLFDGLAFMRFWYWFETNKNLKNINEEILSDKLRYFRSLSKDFVGNSFPTISAFAKNGAIIHYQFTKNFSSKIKKNNLYLIDSGGQYLSGTTDITRTLISGKPTEEMKLYYTRVLKGHLSISNLIFPEGTKGRDIDVLARFNLWKIFCDYNHGTGHGVGHYLNVHEGPISISKNNDSLFSEGMIVSNEPGFYKTNAYGIRIENLELVKTIKSHVANKNFLNFETLTMVPYEKKLINKKLLNDDEILSIDNYHKQVRKKIVNLINLNEKGLKSFIIKKTASL